MVGYSADYEERDNHQGSQVLKHVMISLEKTSSEITVTSTVIFHHARRHRYKTLAVKRIGCVQMRVLNRAAAVLEVVCCEFIKGRSCRSNTTLPCLAQSQKPRNESHDIRT
eukprot:gb/GECG01003680.1/.p1 GENE.gb/GECG01003680.1/~~gb/GECG01003680.1/.p1  ORF type:complete len:111 (+),score=3.20 gb/GECG01003680.1/:1-333(+)